MLAFTSKHGLTEHSLQEHHFVCLEPSCYNHVSPLSQIKGAEESQFILRCDVRFEQQCSAQALQDLGGEKPLNATAMTIIYCVTIY